MVEIAPDLFAQSGTCVITLLPREGRSRKADMTPRLCLLLLLAGPAAFAAPQSCTLPVAADAATDIDYAAINRALSLPEPGPRLPALTAELKRLGPARAPEAELVRQRLLLATALTQFKLGMNVAAAGNLKRLPVDSPLAPEALVLMAEIEAVGETPRNAVRWFRQMADLFPGQELTVRALWRAAELQHPHFRQAIALEQQAARQADSALAMARLWHLQSLQPDFMDKVNGERLPPELWQLARPTFMDAAYTRLDRARREQQCGGAVGVADALDSGRAEQQALLAKRLATAVTDWEMMAAEASYRLAEAQAPRLNPGMPPPIPR